MQPQREAEKMNLQKLKPPKEQVQPILLQKILNDKITYNLNVRIIFLIIMLLLLLRIIFYFALPPYYILTRGIPDCPVDGSDGPFSYCERINLKVTHTWYVIVDNIQMANQFLVVTGSGDRQMASSENQKGNVSYKSSV